MTRNLFATNYTSDFEEARKAYKPPPNCSKADSYRAWVQVKDVRPEQSLIVACIRAYNEYLDGENTQRTKYRQAQYPKAHFSTFLRQQKWEGFLERAKQMIAAEKRQQEQITQSAARLLDTTNPNAVSWERLRKEIGDEAVFNIWFASAEYNATANRLVVPKPFLASQIERKFIGAIHRSFNPDTLVTCEG